MKSTEVVKLKFKNDSYRKSRGVPSLLVISCAQCQEYLMCYQKDGPGPLLRCYIDRIVYPENLAQRQYEVFDKSTASKLECRSCKVVIGSPIIYEKETRPAYHMRPGFFAKKKVAITKYTPPLVD
jgi:hypothetical protein